MNRLQELYQAGTSPWLDYIRRDVLQDGSLAARIEQGQVYGLTSNPSIFAKAFESSDIYDESILAYLREQPESSITDLYEHEALQDIRSAADLLLPVYQDTEKVDGYVSFEVSPLLADDTQGTLVQARRLFQEIQRPNIMIKIPATPEGIPAIRQAIREGININATLIFSHAQYDATVEAFIAGLEDRMEDGQPLEGVASVASVFISRVDRALDALLPGRSPLKLKIGIANARLAYERFQQAFFAKRFRPLREAGAQVQRPLWASTSMKDPQGRDVLYVESLIGPHTVNTIPPATLDAFDDHGEIRMTIADDLEAADEQLVELKQLGIDFDTLTAKLLDNGVQSFTDAYEDLLRTVAGKRNQVMA